MQAFSKHGKKGLPTPEENFATLEKVVSDMLATYPPGYPAFKPDVVEYQMHVGQQCLYAMRDCAYEQEWARAIKQSKDALRCMGIVLRAEVSPARLAQNPILSIAPKQLPILNPPIAKAKDAISSMFHLAGLYKNFQRSRAEKEWLLAAYWVDQINAAPSKELFLRRYKDLLVKLDVKVLDEAKWLVE